MEIASVYKNKSRNHLYIFGLRQWVFPKPWLSKLFECKKKKKKQNLDVNYHPSIRKTHSDSDAWAKMNFRWKWRGDRLCCLICLGYFIINLFASIYFNDHSQENFIYEGHFSFFKGYFMCGWLCSILSQVPGAGLLSSKLLQLYLKCVGALPCREGWTLAPQCLHSGAQCRVPDHTPFPQGSFSLADSEKLWDEERRS